MANTKTPLQVSYEAHHRDHSRYGFSYLGEERGKRFASWIGTGKRILDLGCRDGVLTQYYLPGNRVTGIDIDRHALAIAHERTGMAVLWQDLNHVALPLADRSFDIVVAGEVLEHLEDPAALVEEALRVLRPAGGFVGSVPNSFHWRFRLASLRGQDIEDPTHLSRLSRSDMRVLLRGFAHLELVPIGGMGGRMIPMVPKTMSQLLLRLWPDLLANDLVFFARRIGETPA